MDKIHQAMLDTAALGQRIEEAIRDWKALGETLFQPGVNALEVKNSPAAKSAREKSMRIAKEFATFVPPYGEKIESNLQEAVVLFIDYRLFIQERSKELSKTIMAVNGLIHLEMD
jgi:hypothetical protein